MLYENEKTLQLENETRQRIEKLCRVIYVKLPIQYGMDFAGVDKQKEIVHWAELKNRDFSHDKYGEYVLSFEKILKARELSQATGLPSYLYLAFTDNAILKTRIDDVNDWAPSIGGRTVKKRREADIHPVVMIPSDWFERIA